MKIRFGFVSNSSSSSFVVAFPSCPESADDVLNMMFDGQEGDISIWGNDDKLGHSEIAKRVLSDIKALDNKNGGTLEQVAEEFAMRFGYNPDPFYSNQKDKYGGSWYDSHSVCFGTDRELLDKLANLLSGIAKKSSVLAKQKWAAMQRCPIQRLPYTNTKTYRENARVIEKWQAADEEYSRLSAALLKLHDWKRIDKLERALAKKDAKLFLDVNRGWIFIVEYGDNSGIAESIMEHGDIFRNLPSVRISNH